MRCKRKTNPEDESTMFGRKGLTNLVVVSIYDLINDDLTNDKREILKCRYCIASVRLFAEAKMIRDDFKEKNPGNENQRIDADIKILPIS